MSVVVGFHLSLVEPFNSPAHPKLASYRQPDFIVRRNLFPVINFKTKREREITFRPPWRHAKTFPPHTRAWRRNIFSGSRIFFFRQAMNKTKKHFPSINILLLAVFIIKEAIFLLWLPTPDWLDEKIMSPSTFQAAESTFLSLFIFGKVFFSSVNYIFSANCRNANS